MTPEMSHLRYVLSRMVWGYATGFVSLPRRPAVVDYSTCRLPHPSEHVWN